MPLAADMVIEEPHGFASLVDRRYRCRAGTDEVAAESLIRATTGAS